MSILANKPLSNSSPANEPVGYYGLPVIHRPHWKWLIISYFFLGGISGSSAAIGALARCCGGRPGSVIARHATYVSFLTLLPCPLLLILDLGRPARFLNMLGAFRPSSPMSMGTWAITFFGGAATGAAALQIATDRSHGGPRKWLSAMRTGAAILGGVLGLVVAGYTGVLLAATAVPLWSKQPRLLGPLFLASAMTSGAAAIGAALAIDPARDAAAEEAISRLEVVFAAAEGMLLVCWIDALGATARPLIDGTLAKVVRIGVVGLGMIAPPAVAAVSRSLPARARRWAPLLSATLTLAGVFALRSAIVEGGRRSADDPRATFEMTG